ncbi:MAG: F0F1 ATP synthase subunit epsilon [Planctomycetota bacterium]|nr:F0F1 ATP synthase subunit epsilon [Planctomycetota bacterium]
MADKPFRCKLITPEARIFDARIAYASVPMWDGQRGFMSGASAIAGKLGFGELRVEFVDRYEVGVKVEESGRKSWFIEGGFMQNVADELTILATRAIELDSMTEQAARAELTEANARASTDPTEMERITRDRQRALSKLTVLRARA